MPQKKDCPFCQIAESGKHEQLDDHYPYMVFEPLNPVTPGHRLFVYRHHVTTLNATALGDAMQEAARYGNRRGEQFNLIVNAGPDASQTVEHMHVHYVPRRAGDGLTLPWTGQVKES